MPVCALSMAYNKARFNIYLLKFNMSKSMSYRINGLVSTKLEMEVSSTPFDSYFRLDKLIILKRFKRLTFERKTKTS